MIYVDDVITQTPKSLRMQELGDQWCHLTTDGPIEELHAFAQRLGIYFRRFHDHRSLPHYDITPEERDQALAAGAVYLSAKEQLRRRQVEHQAAPAPGATQIEGSRT